MWNGLEGATPILRVPDRWEQDERAAYGYSDEDWDDDADDDCDDVDYDPNYDADDDIDEDSEAWEEYTASKKWDKIN